jgi:hypothetical protein
VRTSFRDRSTKAFSGEKAAPHAELTGYRFALRETRQNGKIKIESRGSVPISSERKKP